MTTADSGPKGAGERERLRSLMGAMLPVEFRYVADATADFARHPEGYTTWLALQQDAVPSPTANSTAARS